LEIFTCLTETSDIKELDSSLQQLFNTPNLKSTILVGDFNCPNIDWTKQHVNDSAPDRAVQQALIDVDTANLSQIHETPTREQSI
jgi:endonuclease/exonuclease/phosphatase family metal-dependent hydrolase